MSELPAEMGKRDFARHLRCAPSYVTELDRAGRLVLSADGRRVLVADSIARIKETASPDRAGVAQRHAQARGEALGLSLDAGAVQADSAPTPAQEGVGEGGEPASPASNSDEVSYQRARARNEHFKAARAQLEYEQLSGKLVEAAAARAAGAEAGAAMRRALDGLPGLIASLVPLDFREDVYRRVDDTCQEILQQAAGAFIDLGKGAA